MHKSKSGLIKLNLTSKSEITEAFNALKKKAEKFKPYKIIAQPMVNSGLEIIIGGNKDSQFGKLVLIGLGGIYVETFKDFATRVCPITKTDASSMLAQLKSGKIIAQNNTVQNEVVNLLVKASKMFQENSLVEFDLNPVILDGNTYHIIDPRLIRE